MKKVLALTSVALVALWAAGAYAGDYHVTTTLICSDCHVMHYSQSHGYNADGGGIYTPLGAAGPYDYCLRNDPNDLCLTCHDGQAFAPDVLEGSSAGYVREAGALNTTSSSGAYNPADGHTLGSTATAPGGTWQNTSGLECVDCHNAHGSTTAYRNLLNRIIPSQPNPPTWAIGANDLTKDVFETAARSYDVNSVWFNEPGNTGSAVATWCKACHTNFHGAYGGSEVGGNPWVRHPASDADIGALGGGHSSLSTYNGHTNKVKVMDADGQWNPASSTATPVCMSCHKAHGNKNAFGLIFMSGTGTVTEEGDTGGTQVKDTCKQCHKQG